MPAVSRWHGGFSWRARLGLSTPGGHLVEVLAVPGHVRDAQGSQVDVGRSEQHQSPSSAVSRHGALISNVRSRRGALDAARSARCAMSDRAFEGNASCRLAGLEGL